MPLFTYKTLTTLDSSEYEGTSEYLKLPGKIKMKNSSCITYAIIVLHLNSCNSQGKSNSKFSSCTSEGVHAEGVPLDENIYYIHVAGTRTLNCAALAVAQCTGLPWTYCYRNVPGALLPKYKRLICRPDACWECCLSDQTRAQCHKRLYSTP